MNAMNLMDRRFGARVRTDLPLRTYRGGRAVPCRAIDLSPTGVLVRRGSRRSAPLVQKIELDLGRERPLRALARTVWSDGALQALHFIGMSDVDRLDIAQHLDRIEIERRYGPMP